MTGYKVLLVDDEPAILSVLQWALQDFGCHATSALGGRVALSKLQNERFDAMVTDLIMPDLDGFFLMRMAGKLNPEMKIIVMTGSPELLHDILRSGARMDGFMIKPFAMKRLRDVILKCALGKKEGGIRTPAISAVGRRRISCRLVGETDQ